MSKYGKRIFHSFIVVFPFSFVSNASYLCIHSSNRFVLKKSRSCVADFLQSGALFVPGIRRYTFIFYKQLVYKQLALGMQFIKQLLGLNHPSSVSNNTKFQKLQKCFPNVQLFSINLIKCLVVYKNCSAMKFIKTAFDFWLMVYSYINNDS